MRPAEDIRRVNAPLIYSNDSDNLESRMKTGKKLSSLIMNFVPSSVDALNFAYMNSFARFREGYATTTGVRS
jgi:hypothetical protein